MRLVGDKEYDPPEQAVQSLVLTPDERSQCANSSRREFDAGIYTC